jgi:hypothetical protein
VNSLHSTYEVYLDLAYLGDPPEEPGPEKKVSDCGPARTVSDLELPADGGVRPDCVIASGHWDEDKCEFEWGWRKLKDFRGWAGANQFDMAVEM